MAKTKLVNKQKIDPTLVWRILEETCLPCGRLLLILNDGALADDNLGECVPKSLLSYAPSEVVFNPYCNRSWNCGIAMSQKACRLIQEHPAFFTQLLGHELGHARICLVNEHLHAHYCLIRCFIRDASLNEIVNPHELPQELLFDQFGIFLAEQIFSRKQLDKEINEIMKLEEWKGDYSPKLLSLSSTNDLDNLRNDLINFTKPYKENLIELWKEDAARGGHTLTHLIDDYETLFE